jgi:acyl carrier protein
MLENDLRGLNRSAGKLESPALEERLVAMIGKELMQLPAGFDFDADLYRAGLDSMALMRLLILIENHFGLMLAESDLSRENFASIRNIAGLIRNRLQEKH